MGKEDSPEKVVQEIRRKTRRRFSAEEKIRIVFEGLRGEESIAALCRKEGLAPNLYHSWSKEFLEAGKKRLVGDTTREATSTEVVETTTATIRTTSGFGECNPEPLFHPAFESSVLGRAPRWPDRRQTSPK